MEPCINMNNVDTTCLLKRLRDLPCQHDKYPCQYYDQGINDVIKKTEVK